MRREWCLIVSLVVLLGAAVAEAGQPCVSVTLDGTPVPLTDQDVQTLQRDVWKAVAGSLGVVGGISGTALLLAKGHPYVGVATATLTIAGGLAAFKSVEVNIPVVEGPCPAFGPPPDPVPVPQPDPICIGNEWVNGFAGLPAAWWACWHEACPSFDAGDAWNGRFDNLFCAETFSTGPRPIL